MGGEPSALGQGTTAGNRTRLSTPALGKNRALQWLIRSVLSATWPRATQHGDVNFVALVIGARRAAIRSHSKEPFRTTTLHPNSSHSISIFSVTVTQHDPNTKKAHRGALSEPRSTALDWCEIKTSWKTLGWFLETCRKLNRTICEI